MLIRTETNKQKASYSCLLESMEASVQNLYVDTKIHRFSSLLNKMVQYLHISYAPSSQILIYHFGCEGSSLMLAFFTCGKWELCSGFPLCGGFSCYRAQTLGTWASVDAACGFRSWGAWAWLLPGMWNIPRPGIEPMSPELAGEFLTTGPRGKSLSNTLNHL